MFCGFEIMHLGREEEAFSLLGPEIVKMLVCYTV